MVNEPREELISLASFFSGIGGFDIGFQNVGFSPMFHCEKDPFCRAVLGKNWGNISTSEDILKLEADSIPDCRVWTAGFPCQDVSVARGWLGRDGLNGSRTGLFYSFMDLVRKRQPEVVLLENVTGLLSSNDGKDFQTVLSSLCDAGYAVCWRIMNSRYFGSPQSRARIFICAWRGNPKSAVNSLFEKFPAPFPENERLGFLTLCTATNGRALVPKVAYCLAATSGRHTGTDWSRSYVSYFDLVRRLTPAECERLQGFPKDWTSLNLRMKEEDVDAKRYHALGNAVCVPVIQWVASRIKAAFAQPSIETSQLTIGELAALLPRRASESLDAGRLDSIQEKITWKSGGLAFNNTFVTAKVSCSPCSPIPASFGKLIDETLPADRYFLSANAATGILRRVQSQKRTLFGPLHDALGRLSKRI